MSIVPLVKVTLYGPSTEREAALDGLQQLGCVHLNDLRSSVAAAVNVAAPNTDARAALQYLRDSPVRRRRPLTRQVDIDPQVLVKEVLNLRDRSRSLDEERDQLRKRISNLEPWGDFELPPWAQDGPLHFWFYAIPHHQMKLLNARDLAWRVAARDHRFCYVVIVAADQTVDMPVAPSELGSKSLSNLRARLLQVESDLEENDYRRIGLTLYTDKLGESLDEADDQAARDRAALVTRDQSQVFAVQGWAPRARSDALVQFAGDRGLALTVEMPGPKDTPPTLLNNPPALRGGEGLVTFYKTPGYATWDPSTVVFLSFAVFFAMIISDAGYGLVLGLILLATWNRISGNGLRGVFVALVVATILYGMLVGTYFGITAAPGSWLGAAHVLDAGNQSLMMLIAIGIGVAQIGGANLLAAWQRRGSITAFSSLGWTFMVLGGFCALLGKSYAIGQLFTLGIAALGLGGLLVLLCSSEGKFSLVPKMLFYRLVDGLKALTEVSKGFGDVLSYLRLFALGLASIKLAEVFNSLAAGAFASKGVWVLVGLFVLFIGHTINFGMGIMSGVVHGLRLNVIEFFNWSLHEEGDRFEAFAKRAHK
jgi:V/A-type H+-transporting ATPase subunit I